MNKSDQINELAAALCKAQADIEGAEKNSDNPFYKSRYADLSSVWEAIRKPLCKNNLSITQCTTPVFSQGKTELLLETVLMHSSGQYIISSMPVVSEKAGPQAMGSAVSYARRYSLAAIVGVYQSDDDAEIAQGRAPAVVQAKPVTPAQVKPRGTVVIPKDDVPDFPQPNLNLTATPTEADVRKEVLDVAKAAKWTAAQVKEEIKTRGYSQLSDMTPNAIKELILFINGNPNK